MDNKPKGKAIYYEEVEAKVFGPDAPGTRIRKIIDD